MRIPEIVTDRLGQETAGLIERFDESISNWRSTMIADDALGALGRFALRERRDFGRG
jgi:hypothetical protein